MNKFLTSLLAVVVLIAIWGRLNEREPEQWVKAHRLLDEYNWVQLWSELKKTDIEARQDEIAFILVQESDYDEVQELSKKMEFPAKVKLFERRLSKSSLEKTTDLLSKHEIPYLTEDGTVFVEAIDEKVAFHFLLEGGELPSIFTDSEPSDLAKSAGLPEPLWKNLPLGCPASKNALDESFAPYAKKYQAGLKEFGDFEFHFRPYYSIPSLDDSKALKIEVVKSKRSIPKDSIKAMIILDSDLGILPEQIEFQE